MNNEERMQKIKELMTECFMDESVDTYEKEDELRYQLKNILYLTYFKVCSDKKLSKIRIRNKIKTIEKYIEDIENAYKNRVDYTKEDIDNINCIPYKVDLYEALIDIKEVVKGNKTYNLKDILRDLIPHEYHMTDLIDQLVLLRNYDEFKGKDTYFSKYDRSYIFWNIEDKIVYFRFNDKIQFPTLIDIGLK